MIVKDYEEDERPLCNKETNLENLQNKPKDQHIEKKISNSVLDRDCRLFNYLQLNVTMNFRILITI